MNVIVDQAGLVSMTKVQSIALNLAGGHDAVMGRIATAVQARTSTEIVAVLGSQSILSAEGLITHGAVCQLLRTCTRQQLETVLERVSFDAFKTVFGRSDIPQEELESAGLQSQGSDLTIKIMLIQEALGALALEREYMTNLEMLAVVEGEHALRTRIASLSGKPVAEIGQMSLKGLCDLILALKMTVTQFVFGDALPSHEVLIQWSKEASRMGISVLEIGANNQPIVLDLGEDPHDTPAKQHMAACTTLAIAILDLIAAPEPPVSQVALQTRIRHRQRFRDRLAAIRAIEATSPPLLSPDDEPPSSLPEVQPQ